MIRGKIRSVKRSFSSLLKHYKDSWMAPAAMIVALAIPNNYLILKFLAVVLAIVLFYSNISSTKLFKGLSK